MDELASRARALGLTQSEFDGLLDGHGSRSERFWVTGVDSEEAARDRFTQGCYLEYACYTDRWEKQGHAVIKLDHWDSDGRAFLAAEHQVASDGYYQHYAEESLQVGKGVYHLCRGAAKDCKARLPRGDGREVVHVDTWRLLSPRQMLAGGENQYMNALGVQWMTELLTGWRQGGDAGAPVPGKGESGLDARLREMMEEAKAPNVARASAADPPPARKEERGRSPRKKDMSSFLDEQARKRAAERKKEEKRAQERRRSGSDRKRKKKRKRSSDGSEAIEVASQTGSETSSGFPKAPARGGQDLLRLAQKKPGRLLRDALVEMSKFLAEREDDSAGAELWQGRKVMSYVSQVLLVTHPPQKIGIRNHREVISVAMALDYLLAGKTAEAGDLLVQRLKALETSFGEGGWSTARHQELIPAVGASMTNQAEREGAAKAELRNLKLRQALAKAK